MCDFSQSHNQTALIDVAVTTGCCFGQYCSDYTAMVVCKSSHSTSVFFSQETVTESCCCDCLLSCTISHVCVCVFVLMVSNLCCYIHTQYVFVCVNISWSILKIFLCACVHWARVTLRVVTDAPAKLRLSCVTHGHNTSVAFWGRRGIQQRVIAFSQDRKKRHEIEYMHRFLWPWN